jgi:hypothetical protein
MTEKKKKVDMHVQIASKILSDIKLRGIDSLQDFEDELMSNGKVSHANKQKMVDYMKSDRQEAYNDKLRLLII